MNREQVDHTIAQYSKNRARQAYLQGQIRAAQRVVEQMQAQSIGDRVRLTSSPTGLPRGGMPGDPVGELAARDADGEESLRLRQARMALESRREAMARADAAVSAVDAWLLALSPREAFLVTRKRIQGESWRQLMPGYDRTFGDDYSKDSLKRMLFRAMDKIYAVAGEET